MSHPKLIVAKEQEAYQVHTLSEIRAGVPVYEPIVGHSYPDSSRAARAALLIQQLIERAPDEIVGTAPKA